MAGESVVPMPELQHNVMLIAGKDGMLELESPTLKEVEGRSPSSQNGSWLKAELLECIESLEKLSLLAGNKGHPVCTVFVTYCFAYKAFCFFN